MADPMHWRRLSQPPTTDPERAKNQEDQETTSSSVDESAKLLSFDFSKASAPTQSGHAPQTKTFVIKRKGDITQTTVTFYATAMGSAFDKVCKLFKIEPKNAILHYPLRMADNTEIKMTITMNEFTSDQCVALYRTCEEYSLLLIEEIVVASSARLKRIGECLYSTTITKNFTVDGNFYEMLSENPKLCQDFLDKRDYVCLLLGRSCNNFLNPAHFLCHVKGCGALVKLGSFLNLSLMLSHFKKHSKEGNLCCKTLMRRQHYLIRDHEGHNWRKVKNCFM